MPARAHASVTALRQSPIDRIFAGQQGGFVPSWHITVVLESWGTITVVFFAGAGGLLLLIQPDSTGTTRINKLARTFITASLDKNRKANPM
jgi:hypothetical protein